MLVPTSSPIAIAAAPAAIPAPDADPPAIAPVTLIARIGSIDAYRGLVMFLMMAEVLELADVSRALPGEDVWKTLAHHQTHASWLGCSLHDLIQPSFSFLVGVALPFSLARRSQAGHSHGYRTLHAFWRALLLVLLGVFLRSTGKHQTNWTFEDTLTQIGLGYGFLYLLALRSARVQWIALAVILIGYWIAFAVYPLPSPGFDWANAGISPDAPELLSGFAAHWGKNTNIAWSFDTWFLNLFPREKPFTHNGGGYATLSFIPTLGTMILGLLAGGLLRKPQSPLAKVGWLMLAGAIALGAGWGLEQLGVCPVVKRIWTPSWVLFSGGWCFLLLGAFYLVMDAGKLKAWAYPLTVVGMNSIAAYLIAHLFVGFIRDALTRHISADLFKSLGEVYQPLLLGGSILLIEWLLLVWMYRRKVFLRI